MCAIARRNAARIARFEIQNIDLVERVARFPFGLKNELLTVRRKISFAAAPAFENELARIGDEARFLGWFVGRDYFLQNQGAPYDADRLARDVLRAIDRNRAILVKPAVAHAQWLFARLAPTLMNRMAMRFVTAQRSRQAAVRSTAP